MLGQWVDAFAGGIEFVLTKRPEAKANSEGVGLAFHDGSSPAIMRQDGEFWLLAPAGTVDNPLPAHDESWESPVRNPVHKHQRNPIVMNWPVNGNR